MVFPRNQLNDYARGWNDGRTDCIAYLQQMWPGCHPTDCDCPECETIRVILAHYAADKAPAPPPARKMTYEEAMQYTAQQELEATNAKRKRRRRRSG